VLNWQAGLKEVDGAAERFSLGPYESSPNWAGGMGSLPRRDSNLDRDVAIKILPESLPLTGAGGALQARGKMLAALSHLHRAKL